MRTIRSRSTWWCAAAILTFIGTGALALSVDEDLLPFDVDQFLNGPEREDLPWKVSVSTAGPTLQQRYELRISATIYGGRFYPDITSRRDLHFVLKIAAEGDRWDPGYSHTRVAVPAQLNSSQIVTYRDGVYVRPGSYTVALMVYDPLLKKGNVWREHVDVRRLAKDPLPELERDLPDVEFIDHERAWILAKGKEWLPVNNSRNLCIDIVANTSADYDSNPRLGLRSARGPYGVSIRYKAHASSLQILQASSVLSHLKLNKGKVRVSILDTLRMKTLFDCEDAEDFDWQQASEVVAKQNPDIITKDQLGSQREASGYLLEVLSRIMEDEACAPEGESPLKIVIIVSSEIRFAKETKISEVIPKNPAAVRFVYFPLSSYMEDELLKMLQPTKPRVYASDSRSFRWLLADLISYLEELK